jgi:quinol monooxygenase YgiN
MIDTIVRLNVSFTVSEDQLDAFKSIAQRMTEAANAEPGTLGYEWFASADNKRFRLLETYTGASAVEAHFNGPCVVDWVPKLAGIWNVESLELFGDPGPEVREKAGSIGGTFFEYLYGVDR